MILDKKEINEIVECVYESNHVLTSRYNKLKKEARLNNWTIIKLKS